MKKVIITVMVVVVMVSIFTVIKFGVGETLTTEIDSTNMRFENPQTEEIEWVNL